jgi:hypothetical protein
MRVFALAIGFVVAHGCDGGQPDDATAADLGGPDTSPGRGDAVPDGDGPAVDADLDAGPDLSVPFECTTSATVLLDDEAFCEGLAVIHRGWADADPPPGRAFEVAAVCGDEMVYLVAVFPAGVPVERPASLVPPTLTISYQPGLGLPSWMGGTATFAPLRFAEFTFFEGDCIAGRVDSLLALEPDGETRPVVVEFGGPFERR